MSDPYRRPGVNVDLRDYFAAQALVGLLAAEQPDWRYRPNLETGLQAVEVAAKTAYAFADAMLKWRDKVEP